MDIDLLSKMVKELILDDDKVVLPGLGAFVAEIVPATFSDKGYTINPPYRKLYFRSKPDEGTALATLYAESNGVSMDVAERVMTDFISELKSVLFARKTVVFPGLGRLRATKENTVFFVADEDLDIYPEGFALEPISLKTHVETPEEVASVVEGLKAIVEEPLDLELPEPVAVQEVVKETLTVVQEPIPAAEPIPAQEPEPIPEPISEPTPAPKPMPEPEPVSVPEPVPVSVPAKPKGFSGPTLQEILEREQAERKRMLKILLYGVLGLVVAAFLSFIIVSRVCPNAFDNILYTPEELEIINRK
jgi:nucleoid DNA-binding protein